MSTPASTAPKADQQLDKRQEIGIYLLAALPIEPAGVVVLTIRIVVALLCARELIAHEQHRHADREEDRRQKIALLLRAPRENAAVPRRALDTKVPGQIMRMAVLVVLAIGLVVTLVVTDEVLQCKTVMR